MRHGIHVVRDGPSSAPPLLLIHGSGAGCAVWGPLIPALAAQRHVIRVDLPGCGKSPPVTSYDVQGQADRVAAVLDDLGPRPVTVAGHSSGGYVATALAERRPDLTGALALISTGPDLDAFRPQPLLLRILLGPVLGPMLWRVRTDAMIRAAIAATCAGHTGIPDAAGTDGGVRTVAAGSGGAPARAPVIPDDVVADLRGITFRTMSAVLRANTGYLAERGGSGPPGRAGPAGTRDLRGGGSTLGAVVGAPLCDVAGRAAPGGWATCR
ncbi:hypothetical protein Aph02nite_11240 [Actinoplanes philippinensis]|uniref:Alpha/beta hydrolase fold n=1 Tax=Actinoplanes philippinensis TaxID=35752 RepID=A0A1I2A038_9ACTN|nr:alpha/beta fold hydrolase [Actinoplanes philippinensis]GIE75174.1 hypothetical protein Aph02nite_11240 [Actinoplanes philippinensis]SFE37322.1 alpha/beta hydrolase fold [Actinoplanes philippinensis]